MIAPIKGRTLGVPRGLLRFLVLKMLSEKPLSGMEIIKEIETQTGSWKPSPGSIYPLLTRLAKKGFTKEMPRDEGGFKRYVFTEKGKKFLEQQKEIANDFIEKIAFLAPMLVGGFDFGFKKDHVLPSNDYSEKITQCFIFLRQNVDKMSEEDTKEFTEIIDDGYMKLEKIVRRIKNKNQTLSDK